MNFADIQKTWQSPHNRPSTAETESEKMKFIQTLHRRDRSFVIGLTLIFAGLAAVTFIILRNQMIGGSRGAIALDREWSTLVFLGLPWIGAIWALLRYRRLLDRQGDYARSIADSVRALLAQNHFARSKARMVLTLQLVGLPVVAVVIYQLHAVGKMRLHEVVSAAVFFGVAMPVAIGCQLWIYFRKLGPEERRLEALLREYEAV